MELTSETLELKLVRIRRYTSMDLNLPQECLLFGLIEIIALKKIL